MREGNRLAGFNDWAGKLPGAAARIAGVFHCVTADPKLVSVIPCDTVELALAMASILISHATCAFGLMGASVHLEVARRILRWVVDRGERETTKRDTFCAFQGTVKTVDNLEPILRLLSEHNYLRINEPRTKKKPSPVCCWNPTLFGESL